MRPTVLAGGRGPAAKGILDRSFQSVGSPRPARLGARTLAICTAQVNNSSIEGPAILARHHLGSNRKYLRRTLRAAWRESAVHDSMHSQLRTALPPRSIRTDAQSGSRISDPQKNPSTLSRTRSALIISGSISCGHPFARLSCFDAHEFAQSSRRHCRYRGDLTRTLLSRGSTSSVYLRAGGRAPSSRALARVQAGGSTLTPPGPA